MKTEKAVFGAGCFWGIEQEFKKIPGVISTAVGYAGGNYKNPSYQDVCSGKTGHAEVVEVTYDPSKVSYDQLLALFWKIHDPTTLHRQGPDVGAQYRSIILYFSPEQKKSALSSKEGIEASGKFRNKIVTEIVPAADFWRAEEYHQCYLEKQKKPH